MICNPLGAGIALVLVEVVLLLEVDELLVELVEVVELLELPSRPIYELPAASLFGGVEVYTAILSKSTGAQDVLAAASWLT